MASSTWKAKGEAGAGEGVSNKRVFVGNLDWGTTWQDLKDHMGTAGEVKSADIFETSNGRSKGSGMVEYCEPAGAQRALDEMSETKLGERLIFVREDRGPSEAASGKGSKGKGKSGKGKSKDDRESNEAAPGKGGKGKGKSSKGKGKSSKGNGKGKSKDESMLYRPSDKGRLLYVGNLNFDASWQDVKEVFKDYGKVIRVDTPVRDDGRSKGYGLVLYETEEEAALAIHNLHDTEFQERRLVVREENHLTKDNAW